MLHHPKVSDPSATVGQVRALLRRAKVHNALLVDGAGRLLAVVEPADLEGHRDDELVLGAVGTGTLAGRTVRADDQLDQSWGHLRAEGRRRLAVVDDDGLLVGLLCLKRHGAGFCSDADVRARERERLASAAGQAASAHQTAENATSPATRLPTT